MSVVEALAVEGRRRDLRQLAVSLREVKPGQFAAATFRSLSLGPHIVTGTVVEASGPHTLMVGGKFLDTRNGWAERPRMPHPDLFALHHADIDESSCMPSSVGPEQPKLDKIVASLVHGDIVEAVLRQSPHGVFTVVGFSVWAPAGGVFIVGGEWRITAPEQPAAADRLVDLKVLAAAADHRLRVPEPIRRWPEEDPENEPDEEGRS